jgi:regulator of sigma D
VLSYRKSKVWGWAVFGPFAELKVGTVEVYRRTDDMTVPVTVERVSRPFDVDGVPHAYGKIAQDTPRTPVKTTPNTGAASTPSVGSEASASSNGFALTPEQVEIIDRFKAGETFKVQAYAGAGKTSTLKKMAESVPDKTGRYLAFNRAIVDEAQRKMPGTVEVTTAHKMALDHTPPEFVARFRLLVDPKLVGPGRLIETARRLRIEPIGFQVTDTQVITWRPGKLAGVVTRALRRFCQSADTEPAVRHFEVIDTIEAEGDTMGTNNRRLAEHLLPALKRAWADLCDPRGALLTYDHDAYLKQFQLSGTVLDEHFVLVDEAQDLSPVLLAIIKTQIRAGIQTVLVGDTFQSIYSFTGAVNAMELAPIETTLYLTKSFRFGPAIAGYANRVLDYLGAAKPLVGNETIADRVGRNGDAKTVLTRSRAAAMGTTLDEIKAEGKPLLIGSVKEIAKLVEALVVIQNGRTTEHPELSWATSWNDVLAHAAEEDDGELRQWVDLLEEYDGAEILAALKNMPTREDRATRIISTAHKVKGLEWPSVRLHGGIGYCNEQRPLDPEEARLLYVALTRAQTHLDVSAVKFFRRES